MEKILVAGGAGYIGSHTVKELLRDNYQVVVIDDLSTGFKNSLDKEVIFYEGNINDRKLLSKIFTDHKINVVMNFAADISVAESVSKPLKYFSNNSVNFSILLEVMNQFNIKKIIFSSTAAVYGEIKNVPVVEDEPKNPINPYGFSKRVSEQLIQYCADAFDFKYVIFRYFNVSGADRSGNIGLFSNKNPLTHLIPVVVETALGIRPKMVVYGDDWDTRDGSCIRDYIHVSDLAQAHVLAIKQLSKKSSIYNLGSNSGYSVLEVIKATEKIIDKKINYSIVKRRAGDPPILVADANKAINELKWQPKYNLEEIIKSDVKWRKKLLAGFSYNEK